MTDEDIKRLRELCEAATPAPWEYSNDGSQVIAPCPCCGLIADCAAYGFPGNDREFNAKHHYNSAFIAAARTALPALLDEVEKLRAEARDLGHELIDAEARAERAEAVVEAVRAAREAKCQRSAPDGAREAWQSTAARYKEMLGRLWDELDAYCATTAPAEPTDPINHLTNVVRSLYAPAGVYPAGGTWRCGMMAEVLALLLRRAGVAGVRQARGACNGTGHVWVVAGGRVADPASGQFAQPLEYVEDAPAEPTDAPQPGLVGGESSEGGSGETKTFARGEPLTWNVMGDGR